MEVPLVIDIVYILQEFCMGCANIPCVHVNWKNKHEV